MNNIIKSTKEFFTKLMKNKNFKRFYLPISVALIGVVLIITAPWQAYAPNQEFPNHSPPPGVEDTPTPTPGESPTPPPEESPTPAPTPGLLPGEYNPLTGEKWDEDLSRNRPWAISINNYRESLPQQGIAHADIIYEFITEGGSNTRMIALYQDASDAGVIGSVRSAREYMLEIAESYDAMLVHASGRLYDGRELFGSPLTRRDTIDVNGVWVGRRDNFRKDTLKMQFDATLVVDGDRLTERIYDLVIRREHKETFEHSLRFREDGAPENGRSAVNVDVKFTGHSKTTTFIYSESNKTYHVRQYNGDLVDTVNSSSADIRLTFTNVLVIQTDIRLGINTHGHSRVTTVGTGAGYFICGGKYTEITWSREEGGGYMYYMPDGSQLELGIGKTYICIVMASQDPVFS